MNKFDDEGLSKYVNKVSHECAKSSNDICDILSGTIEDLDSYTKGEIG